jgi:hypothetical protein
MTGQPNSELHAAHLAVMEVVLAAVTARVNGETAQLTVAVAELTRSHEQAVMGLVGLLDVCRSLTETVGVSVDRSARDVWAEYATDWAARAAAGGFPWQASGS